MNIFLDFLSQLLKKILTNKSFNKRINLKKNKNKIREETPFFKKLLRNIFKKLINNDPKKDNKPQTDDIYPLW